jgi:hypothetical protein
MGQLSLEFYRQAAMAEGYVYEDNLSGAEGHRLITEAIHHVLKTLESKRCEAVEVEVASTITDIVTNKTEEGGGIRHKEATSHDDLSDSFRMSAILALIGY